MTTQESGVEGYGSTMIMHKINISLHSYNNIIIIMDIKSTCEESINVTQIPEECCFIEKGDVKCGVTHVGHF